VTAPHGRDGARGRLLVVAAALLWGTTGTAQALGPPGASPAAVGTIRVVFGGIVLVAVAATTQGVARPRLHVGALVVAGAAMAGYQLFFFSAVRATGVAIGTVVAIGSSPVIAALGAKVVHGERLRGRWVLGTALAAAGCVLLLAGGRSLTVNPPGVLLALGAGLCYACYAVSSKRLLDGMGPVRAAALTFGLAALLLAPSLLVTDLSWVAQPRGLLLALHLGVGATAVAYVLFTRGLALVPVTTATTLTLAEPLTAAMLGILVLGERLTPIGATGAALLLGGLAAISGRVGAGSGDTGALAPCRRRAS
jgi:DME family drug/metabolite transporter